MLKSGPFELKTEAWLRSAASSLKIWVYKNSGKIFLEEMKHFAFESGKYPTQVGDRQSEDRPFAGLANDDGTTSQSHMKAGVLLINVCITQHPDTDNQTGDIVLSGAYPILMRGWGLCSQGSLGPVQKPLLQKPDKEQQT